MICLGVVLALASTASATTYFYEGAPFGRATSTYQGTAIGGGRSAELYDLQPSVIYEPGQPGGDFKMWWLGQYRAGDLDLAPASIPEGDRIYYSHSSDGNTWSTPQVVLKGLGGSAGTDRADDHLVGSPSVLHFGGTYYMFYEAYGNWMTAIDRFWSPSGSNTLVTGAQDWYGHANAYSPYGFGYEKTLGFAPYMPKAGTIPIYAGVVVYGGGTLKVNHFLDRSTAKCSQGTVGKDLWQCTNNKQPVFWLYTSPAEGRVPIYECYDAAARNTFATSDPNCEGHGVGGVPDGGSYLLGYAAAGSGSGTQTAPDMRRANQNRIMLATSTDGINWTRFNGAEDGGAVIAPQQAYTTSFPSSACPGMPPLELNVGYGAGYPGALERDGYLELYFTDSLEAPTACNRLPSLWRVRIPIGQILNGAAYKAATREPNANPGDDIKWSPARQRYFVSFIQGGGGSPGSPGLLQSPMLMWSAANPSPTSPATIPDTAVQNELYRPNDQSRLPTNWDPGSFDGRLGANGAIAGDGLGHTIDVPTADPGDPPNALDYSVYHMYYAAQTNSKAASPFEMDLDHNVVFGYDKAAAEEPSAPAVSTWGPGRLDVFIRGTTDNALWHKYYANGNWSSGWEARGGAYDSAPAAVSWGPGRIDAVIKNVADAHVAHQFWLNNGWFADDLGGTIVSAPGISSWGEKRLDVFVRGLGDRLYHRYYNGISWSGWEDLTAIVGGTISSAPSAVSWGPNRIDVVAEGSTPGSVYHVYWANNWWYSDYIPGPAIKGAPAITSWREPGRLDVFARRASDNHLMHTYYWGGWANPWEDVSAATGTTIASPPSAAAWGTNRLDVVARVPNGSVEQFYWINGWFHNNLGGANQ